MSNWKAILLYLTALTAGILSVKVNNNDATVLVAVLMVIIPSAIFRIRATCRELRRAKNG